MSEKIIESLKLELDTIWKAHARVGLEGKMCLYTLEEDEPWRAEQKGIKLWFGHEETETVVEHIDAYYNDGELPNTPLLLNPIVHGRNEDGGEPIPLGSGIMWCTSYCLGIDKLKPDSLSRIKGLGVLTSSFHRGANEKAGLKMFAFSNKALKPDEKTGLVEGCRALYEVANISSEEYWGYYVLSGVEYLSKNGMYKHPHFADLFEDEADLKKTVKEQYLLDAATCWKAYDRHNALFLKFGVDVHNLKKNLRYFNLCARDFGLYDSTGLMREGADEKFEFVVPGWIPKGAVTLMAATGGTGKSSIAHSLCVMCSIDYEKGEEVPKWLGSEVNLDLVKDGICVYFSGEDGPAIINARGELFDPKQRASRLMFHRNDFGEGVTLPQFMKRLAKMDHVPIMVIDPARKYLTGDEDNSEIVSEFFEAIEEFAISKGTAMIVVHHLSKNANPQSAAEVREQLRGSQVFIDRPRVVIGMYRDGPYTCVGLAKNNIPPNLGMLQGERVFVRDPKTLQLLWLPGEKGVKNDTLSEAELAQLREEAEYKALLTEKKG